MRPESVTEGRPDPAAGTIRSVPAVPERDSAVIRAHPDGPFLVRGPVTVLDEEGRSVTLRRKVVALCRCGHSRTQPMCDGMHTPAGFTCPRG
jgi:hypothetical protein